MVKRSLNIVVCSIVCVAALVSCSDSEHKEDADSFIEKMFNSTKRIVDNELPPAEYIKWVENTENGLRVNKTIGDFTYSTMYKPYEYLALLELRNDTITKQKLEQKINEYNGFQYFTFRIAANQQKNELLKVNLHSDDEYYSRIEYFSFNMQNDLKLVDGKDTLDCVMFHYERVYGLAPYATFVIGFPITAAEEQKRSNNDDIELNDKTIKFTDNVFGAGNVFIRLNADNLNSIPKLKLD